MARIKLLIYASGIGLSYWYFGVVQEKITRTKHEPGSEMFTCTMTLVLLQCIFNTIFAKFILAFVMRQGRDRTKSTYYGICSLTYLTAMVSSNMALQHVNYPTQVIGKSCKPIPIMILGVLLGKKRYSLKKYFFVTLIVLGVALFLYKKNLFDNNFLSSNETSPSGSLLKCLTSIGIGELLLILSLTMDGLTGAVQERMKTDYQTKSGHMMFKINLWSSFYLSVATIASGELIKFYFFIQRHPNLIGDIALFSALSAIGQFFIFLTVTEFGPLPCSIVTTTRKFFTVLTSVFYFGNTLNSTEWIGTSLVFQGLILDAFFGKDKSHQQVPPKKQSKKIE